MLSEAQLSDISKMIKNNTIESQEQFIQILDELYNARIKDPVRVETQLRILFCDTKVYTI